MIKSGLSIILIGCCCIALSANAQTFSEWFRQAKTQKKYLLQQILAYQQYLGYLNKGYSIVKNKNSLINSLKQADLDQHKDKYDRLKKASITIRQYPKVTAILNLEAAILPIATKATRQAAVAAILSPVEANYIKKVFDQLLEQCDDVIEELSDLLTSGEFQLSDEERLKRIDQLYADMQVKYTFAYSFNSESRILRLVRAREANTINNRKLIYQRH